jgi:hypothetical protein
VWGVQIHLPLVYLKKKGIQNGIAQDGQTACLIIAIVS